MSICCATSKRARALFTWNINIAASNPRQADLRDALNSDDLFHVAIDLFPTDTVDHADIILPAASFLEFDDLVMSYFDLTVSAQAAAQPLMGDALPNQEIFRRLAKAMGYTDADLIRGRRDDPRQSCAAAGSAGFRQR